MNYYDAQQIRLRHVQKQPVDAALLAEANAFVERMRGKPGEEQQQVSEPTAPIRFISTIAPTFDTPCECGARYGMHRVNDYACPNQEWLPGNGRSQWLTQKWKRA